MKTLKPLDTINVIEMDCGTIESLHSYPNTIGGKKLAENRFVELVGEHSPSLTVAELRELWDEGTFDMQDGYQVYVVFSSKI